MTLENLQKNWVDTSEFHKDIHEYFINWVNEWKLLSDHRTYVETRVFGMGERSFWWLWKLICDELPNSPRLLEIGVFKAATLSLWKLLRSDAHIFGLTPLDGRGTGWTEDDYAAHIRNIHDDFGLEQPTLFVGSSHDADIIEQARGEYDVIYIDGDHSYEGAMADLVNYAPMVKQGGFLVIDDACCDMKMPWGYFQGIKEVTDATLTYINQSDWEFIGNCVHLRVYIKL